jgi:hypothetical protein
MKKEERKIFSLFRNKNGSCKKGNEEAIDNLLNRWMEEVSRDSLRRNEQLEEQHLPSV